MFELNGVLFENYGYCTNTILVIVVPLKGEERLCSNSMEYFFEIYGYCTNTILVISVPLKGEELK